MVRIIRTQLNLRDSSNDSITTFLGCFEDLIRLVFLFPTHIDGGDLIDLRRWLSVDILGDKEKMMIGNVSTKIIRFLQI